MPTAKQIQLIRIAQKDRKLNDAAYRVLLANVAGVKSTKDLDNRSIEDVMDVLEGMGFVDSHNGEGYWGNKVQRRGEVANERMLRKIEAMAAETKYPVGAMVHRMTNHRTDRPEQLYPREAWMLIEAYKSIIERDTPQPDLGPMNPSPIDVDHL
jgi:hypothetical protein